MTSLNFHRPAPAVSERDIAAAVAALGYPAGWTAQDDVALMEGLFRGLGLQAIGTSIGKPFGATQARFLALRKAAVAEGPLTIDAQTALLRIVRDRATTGFS